MARSNRLSLDQTYVPPVLVRSSGEIGEFDPCAGLRIPQRYPALLPYTRNNSARLQFYRKSGEREWLYVLVKREDQALGRPFVVPSFLSDASAAK